MPKYDDYNDSWDTSIVQQRIGNKAAACDKRSYNKGKTTSIDDAAAITTAGGVTTLLKTDDKFGKFVNTKWRPLMAFLYMITCFTDFVLFPILWSILQASSAGQITSQWLPLTLQGAGLYHLAMGAVLGLAAYGRTQEKIAGKD